MPEKVLDSEGFNAVTRGRYGYYAYNKNDKYIGQALEAYGEYSEAEVALFRQLCRAGDVVVEVGANIGAHTLPLARAVQDQGRVYAFEPQRIVFQTLCATLALNSIRNVDCRQVAASSENGHVLIPEIRYDMPGNFGGVSVRGFKEGRKVRAAKLDDELELEKLKLLKIDVEGMEGEVLAGAAGLIRRCGPILYVENDRVERSKELIEQIRAFDYRLYWHLPPLYNPNNFAARKDNLYPGIVSINMLCVPSSSRMELRDFREISDSGEHPLKRQ